MKEQVRNPISYEVCLPSPNSYKRHDDCQANEVDVWWFFQKTTLSTSTIYLLRLEAQAPSPLSNSDKHERLPWVSEAYQVVGQFCVQSC